MLALPWATVARKLRPVVWILAAIVVLTLVSLAFNPSSRGVQTVLRLVAAVAIPILVIPFLSDRWARRLVLALIVGVAFQAGIGALQVIRGPSRSGLTQLGELGELREIGDPGLGQGHLRGAADPGRVQRGGRRPRRARLRVPPVVGAPG